MALARIDDVIVRRSVRSGAPGFAFPSFRHRHCAPPQPSGSGMPQPLPKTSERGS